ncbi:CHAT domain-containing protein [Spirosoma sordidisoli]|uniref:CHAT domain-containing protein n=1 Tax=Spirosoma sordidisoli TaxID=2502893 RepID=A0A4Q2UMP2_9BACT|nr:CHAT domain-containing protein [Spirosoma sordidisoli]RYC70052.1 CHAT domain-containing protein [Spirosoma sordidisoli]
MICKDHHSLPFLGWLIRLGLFLSLMGISTSVDAQPIWLAKGDSANAYLAKKDYVSAYAMGLRAAQITKPTPQADSVWSSVYSIAGQLPDSVSIATAIKAGTYYVSTNEDDLARTWLLKALSKADHLQLRSYQYQSRVMLAKIELRKQAFDKAGALYISVLNDTTATEYTTYQIEALLGLSGVCVYKQQIDSAKFLSQKALVAIKKLPGYEKSRLYPIAKSQQTLLALLENDLTTALRESEESYSVASKIMPNDPLIIGIAYQYAYIQGDINDQKALDATRLARRVLNQQPNHVRHPHYLYLYANEIALLRVLDRNQEAALLADSVLQKHPLDELITFAGADNLLSRITQTYIGARRTTPLEKIVQKVQEWVVNKSYKESLNPSFLYSLLGRYYQHTGNYVEAVRCLKEEWRLDSLAYGGNQINFSLMNRLATCQAKAGQRADAYTSFNRLVTDYERNIRTNIWLMSDAERDNYLQTTTVQGLFWHFLHRRNPVPEEIELAYNYKLINQGVRLHMNRTINRYLYRQNNGHAGLPTIRQLMETRIRLSDRRFNGSAEQRQQWQQQADSLERSMGGEAIALNQALRPVRWQHVQAKLKPGEAAVEIVFYTNYSRGEEVSDSNAYAAFLIRPGWITPQVISLPDPASLGHNVNSNQTGGRLIQDYYRNIVFSPINQKRVFEQFWQPISDALGPVNRLYMAMDGGYQRINPCTIQNPRTKRYISGEVEIVLLNSTQDLLASPQPSTSRTAELIGHPAYTLSRLPVTSQQDKTKRSRQSRLRNGIKLDELPYTEIEVRQLAKLFRSFRLQTRERLDTSASEKAFQRMQSPKILHVATHGLLRDSSSQITSGSLLNCGLALAGAADTSQHKDHTDGLLTGYEASLLNLHNTELVTLSACESGAGDYVEGEGINGLQRAFLLAGAQSVLVSLWKVEDQLTQQLMNDFYRFWLAGASKPQALYKAQAVLRRQHPNPYYWGAFVLLGQ